MDYRVHGILQARIPDWVVFFSRGSQADFLPGESQGKLKNTGVGSLCLLQWIFLTQESNWDLWGLLNYRQILYQPSYQGSTETGKIQAAVKLDFLPL